MDYWNIHYYLWFFFPNINSSMETNHIVDWLIIHGYLLKNTSSQHTYIFYTSQRIFSVLDLIFAKGLATQYTILSDWTIKPKFAFNSDHLAI